MTVTAASSAMNALESAGPLLVWIIVLSFVFAECGFIIGLFLPGDSLLFAAGVVLAEQHHEGQAWALAGAATVTAVLGNHIGYLIGRKTGHAIVTRRGGKVLNRANLQRAQDFLDRRGFWAIVLARWIPWIRTLAPLVAGAAKMNHRRFIAATSIGGLCWVPTLVLLGYYGAGLLDQLPWLKTTAVIVTIAFSVAGTGWGIWRYRQEMRKPAETVSAGSN